MKMVLIYPSFRLVFLAVRIPTMKGVKFLKIPTTELIVNFF